MCVHIVQLLSTQDSHTRTCSGDLSTRLQCLKNIPNNSHFYVLSISDAFITKKLKKKISSQFLKIWIFASCNSHFSWFQITFFQSSFQLIEKNGIQMRQFFCFSNIVTKKLRISFVNLGYVDRETNRLFRPFENCTGVFKLSLQTSHYILCAKIVTFPYVLMFNHVLYVFESKAKIS